MTTNNHISVFTVALTALAGLACATPGARESSEGEAQAQLDARLRSAEVATERRKSTSSEQSSERAKRGFVQSIEKLAEDNRDFRRVLYTAKHSQLVVMALPPREHIGTETHDVDQFFRVEEGTGEVVIGETRTPIGSGFGIVIPAGTKHDVINTGATPLHLYTIYSPPQHRDGVVHHTRADAQKDEERFDGKTTE